MCFQLFEQLETNPTCTNPLTGNFKFLRTENTLFSQCLCIYAPKNSKLQHPWQILSIWPSLVPWEWGIWPWPEWSLTSLYGNVLDRRNLSHSEVEDFKGKLSQLLRANGLFDKLYYGLCRRCMKTRVINFSTWICWQLDCWPNDIKLLFDAKCQIVTSQLLTSKWI